MDQISFSYFIFISMLAQLPFDGSRTHTDTCLWFGREHLWGKIFYTLKIFIGMLIHKTNGPPAPTPSMPYELELTQPLQTVAICQRLVVAGGGFFLLLDLGPGAAACGMGIEINTVYSCYLSAARRRFRSTQPFAIACQLKKIVNFFRPETVRS